MSLPIINNTIGALSGFGGAALVIGSLHLSKRIATQKWVNACQYTYGALNQTQQRTIRQIVQTFNNYGDGDIRKLAYILATVEVECSFVSKKEHPTQYNIRKEYWRTGYMGRGLVQLTGLSKYVRFSRLLGVDLVNYPDRAIELQFALPILVLGMMHGYFTGRSLSHYINGHQADFYQARRVVNSLDKAERLARATTTILNYYYD